jgi:hypothetical protein
MYEYIEDVIDVKGDGHCGFRVVAFLLGRSVDRVGNRPGQAYEFFLSLSLAYDLSNAIFLAWPGSAKSLAL